MEDMLSQFDNDSMFDDDGSMGGIPAGYQHEYRKYSRQYIVEVCNSLAEIIKPDAYKELEKNEDVMSLFREEPCKEWAPLPSMEVLFPTDERRSSEDQYGDFGGSESERKDRAASWSRNASGRRQGRSDAEAYHEEADWAEDPSWGRDQWSSWQGGGDWSREGDWAAGPKWVEKGKTREGEEGGDGQGGGKGESAYGGSRQPTWAEKVRGSEGTGQRWVAKKKAEPAEPGDGKEKTDAVQAVEGQKSAAAKPEEKPDAGVRMQ